MSELGNVVQLVNRLQGACTLLGTSDASRLARFSCSVAILSLGTMCRRQCGQRQQLARTVGPPAVHRRHRRAGKHGCLTQHEPW